MSEPQRERSTRVQRLGAWLRGKVAQERAHFEAAQAEATGRFGLFEAGLTVVAAVGLTAMTFLGHPETYLRLFQPDRLSAHWLRWGELTLLLYWIMGCLIGYLLLPMIYLRLWGRSIRDYYLGFEGFRAHLPVYLALVTPMLLIALWASFWPDFQLIYPFYSLAGRSWTDLLIWELAYGLQFIALEFFFRAFILEGLRPAIGYGSIWIMIIPYCCIHFQKTGAESLGSIVAGVVLGWMALRTRSIWGGVLAHWIIAVEMDLLSLLHKGQWPTVGWPP